MNLSSLMFSCHKNHKCHKIHLNCDGSYIGFPDWIKIKKAAINLLNKKITKCFQYAVTVALNHEEIKKDPQRITKIKPSINKYNCERIHFDDLEKVGKNKVTIALNVLYIKKKKIILLMFQNKIQIVKSKLFF